MTTRTAKAKNKARLGLPRDDHDSYHAEQGGEQEPKGDEDTFAENAPMAELSAVFGADAGTVGWSCVDLVDL
jgi:hypothetical protein